MGAIYCEPCIAARLQGSAPAQPVVPVAVVEGAPSPGLAAFLGFIPGVGAMYNGQFVKAFIHVVIFATLVMVVDHAGPAEPFFGLMIAAFIFYMVFEAHQTAKARQLGRPLPDFLGLDRLFGIQENQPPAATTVPPGAATIPGAAQPPGRADGGIPTGAVVLVGLGVFFLLQNFGLFHVGRMWPLLLIGFGLWVAYKRTAERV
jgi:hypothetical protein